MKKNNAIYKNEPWVIQVDKNIMSENITENVYAIYNAKKDTHICDTGSIKHESAKRNALFISTAPEMFEMLLIIKEQADRGEIKLDKITYGSIVQTLKKATGEKC